MRAVQGQGTGHQRNGGRGRPACSTWILSVKSLCSSRLPCGRLCTRSIPATPPCPTPLAILQNTPPYNSVIDPFPLSPCPPRLPLPHPLTYLPPQILCSTIEKNAQPPFSCYQKEGTHIHTHTPLSPTFHLVSWIIEREGGGEVDAQWRRWSRGREKTPQFHHSCCCILKERVGWC